MITFKKEYQQGIQGDVAFTRVDKLPEGLVQAEPDQETGHIVVAHSETGHHHAFAAQDGVALMEDPNDPLVAYLQVNTPSQLQHHRSFDPHQTILFESGTYRINRHCEVCAEHLSLMRNRERGHRPVILLELPKEFEDEEVKVTELPEGDHVHRVELTDDVIWYVTAPVHIEVAAGVVRKALEGKQVLEH